MFWCFGVSSANFGCYSIVSPKGKLVSSAMFLLLLWVLSAVDGVPCAPCAPCSPSHSELGSGLARERRIYFKGLSGYNKKDIDDDDIFLDLEPEMIPKGKVDETDNELLIVSPNLISYEQRDTTDESVSEAKSEPFDPMRFYDVPILVIGALSMGVTVALALALMVSTSVSACRRRRSDRGSGGPDEAKAADAEAAPTPPPPPLRGPPELPKIEFTFEMDKNLLKRHKSQAMTEKSFVKSKPKPRLPPKQRIKSDERCERHGKGILTKKNKKVRKCPQKELPDSDPEGHCSLAPQKRTVLTRAEVHQPPKEEVV